MVFRRIMLDEVDEADEGIELLGRGEGVRAVIVRARTAAGPLCSFSLAGLDGSRKPIVRRARRAMRTEQSVALNFLICPV